MPPKPVPRAGSQPPLANNSSAKREPQILPSPLLKGKQLSTKPINVPRQSSPANNNNSLSHSSSGSAPSPPRKRTLFGFLVNSFLLYLLAAHFFLCPAPSNSSHATVCNAIDRVGAYRTAAINYIEPHTRPYINQAQAHLEPYTAPLAPYYHSASAAAAPHATRARKIAQDTWRQRIVPASLVAATVARQRSQPVYDQANKHWNTHAQPHVSRLHKQHVEPFVDFGRQRIAVAKQRLDPVRKQVYSTYSRTSPHVVRFYNTRAKPAGTVAYGHGQRAWVGTVQPALVKGGNAAWSGIKTRVVPVVVRFWSVYVQPQVERIRDRVFEYKMGSKGRQAVKDARTEVREALKADGEDVGDVEDFIKGLKKELEAEKKVEAKRKAAEAAGKHVKLRETRSEDEIKEEIRSRRRVLQKAQDTYQAEVARVGEQQRDLLVEKLADLRKSTPKDISNRFDARAEALERNGNSMIDKLEIYLQKLLKQEGEDETGEHDEDRTSDALGLIEKIASKIYDRADEAFDEVAEYGKFYEGRELDAAAVAYEPLRQLGSVKEGELSMGWAWLEDVTVKDWSRFHADKNQNRDLLKSFQDLATSSPPWSLRSSLPANPVPSLLSSVESSIEAAVNRLESRIDSVRNAGPRGARDSIVARASAEAKVRGTRAAAAAAAGAAGAAALAKAKLPLPGVLPRDPEPVGVADRVLAAYREAGRSASGWAESLPSPGDAATEAVRAAQRAVGIEPSPTDVRGHVESAYAQATKSIASAYGDLPSASQYAHDGFRAGQRAVGIQPDPETPTEYLESFASKVSSAAASAYSNAPSPSQIAHDGYRAGKRAVGVQPDPETPGEYIESIVGQVRGAGASVAGQAASAYSNLPSASQAAHDSYRQAQRAAGVQPDPETPGEYLESIVGQVRNAGASVADQAASAYSDLPSPSQIAHDSYRDAQRAVGVQPSPEGILEHVQSGYQQATAAAGSFLSEFPSPSEGIKSVQANVGDGADAARQHAYDAAKRAKGLVNEGDKARQHAADAAKRAIGLDVQPTGVIGSAQSLLGKAQKSGEAAYAAGAKAGHDNYRAAQRAAGIKPDPEGVLEHVQDGYQRATKAAGDFLSDFPAPTDASNYVRDAVGDLPDMGQAVHDGVREAQRKVGVEPTPEGFGEHVASGIKSATQAVGSAASQASAKASQIGRDGYREAVKAAGGRPEPENIGERAENAYDDAAEAVNDALNAAKEAIGRLGREEL